MVAKHTLAEEVAGDLLAAAITLEDQVHALRRANESLHDTLRAVTRACTLPEDTAPASLPAQVEDCLRDLSGQIERLTRERDRLQRACNEGLPRERIDCPACGKPHVEWFRHDAPGIDGRVRPHHTHRCYDCGHVWDSGRWSFGIEPSADVTEAPAFARGTYRHYKGDLYAVVDVAHDSTNTTNGRWMVLYRNAKGGPLYARDISEFTETVEHDGVSVPRFARVEQ